MGLLAVLSTAQLGTRQVLAVVVTQFGGSTIPSFAATQLFPGHCNVVGIATSAYTLINVLATYII